MQTTHSTQQVTRDIYTLPQSHKIQDSTTTQPSFHAPSKINPKFITTFKKSCIIISNDFQNEINYLNNTYKKEDIRIFELEELKIDHVHTIIQEAHIATQHDRIIAIFAFSYNHFAQNALLKILEEPPAHIIFMLYISARNKLIPTIFSRLVVFNKSKKKHVEAFKLDITQLTIPIVYEYICQLEKENISHEQGRIILTQILEAVIAHNMLLDRTTLEYFDLALQALYSKQSVHFALLPILLSLVTR